MEYVHEYVHIVIGYLDNEQDIIMITRDIEKANLTKKEFSKNDYSYTDVKIISRPLN